MCGLFAFIKTSSRQLVSSEINRIQELLAHRGPDGQGCYQDENYCLIHKRLAVIAIDESAAQPFFSSNKEWALVYNGEIYNYRQVRSDLINCGVRFRTQSDTEVLLNAIIHWGLETALTLINGMFSFVAVNLRTKKCFVVRDRLGVKPLYYLKTSEGYFFSSEIKPLLIFKPIEVNPDSLNSYIQLRYVPGPKTLFKNIEQIPPGTYATLDTTGFNKKTWWSFDHITPDKSLSPQQAQEKCWELLSDAIKIRNIADVPLGSFLSGGIDSATITAQLASMSPKINATTLSIPTKQDESRKAKDISNYLNINHHIVNIGPRDFDLYKKGLYHLENPIGDSIIVPTLILARETAKMMKVVLSGEGADEVFSGYIHHQFLALEGRIAKIVPSGFEKILALAFSKIPQTILELLFPYPSKLGVSGKNKIVNHLSNLKNPYERYQSLVWLFHDDDSRKLWSLSEQGENPLRVYWNSLQDQSPEQKLRKLDLKYWTPDYTLHRLDRLTMAYGLEGRVPFYDYRLVELSLRCQSKLVMNWRRPKQLLRDSIPDKLLPSDVIARRKQSFYLPVEEVFHESFFTWAKENILDNSNKRPWINKIEIERWLSRKDWELLDSKRLQVILNLELWAQIFLDEV